MQSNTITTLELHGPAEENTIAKLIEMRLEILSLLKTDNSDSELRILRQIASRMPQDIAIPAQQEDGWLL